MSAAGGCLRFLAKLHSRCASLRGPRCREPLMGVEPTLFSAERLLAQPTGGLHRANQPMRRTNRVTRDGCWSGSNYSPSR